MFQLSALLLSVVALAPLPLRTWNDSTGAFSVEARFDSVDGDFVILRKASGDVLRVPRDRLSDADRAYVARNLPAERKPAARKSAEVALVAKVQYEFVETPLTDAIEYFEDLAATEIVVDRRALDEVGIGTDTPLTAKGSAVALEDSLTRLLKPLELTWMVTDEVILITTPEKAEYRLVTEVYGVRGRVNTDKLIEEITANIAPDSWDEVGGPGSVAMAGGNVMLVSQTYQNQAALRKAYPMLLQLIEGPAAPPPARRSGKKVGPEEALLQATMLEFIETPLSDVAAFFSDRHGVNIELDEKALDNIGIGTDTPITCSVKGIALKSALNIMLRELDLTWSVDKERILITTPEAAEESLILHSHRIDDIARIYPPDTLQEAVEYSIAPSMWESVGGPASIRLGVRGTLDIRQTYQIHRQIDDLLTRLRLAAK